MVAIPDLSQPSLYHAPRGNAVVAVIRSSSVWVLCAQLEQHLAVKLTKRDFIMGRESGLGTIKGGAATTRGSEGVYE